MGRDVHMVDAAVDALAAINLAAAVLAAHPSEGVRAIGAWLADGGSAELFAFISGEEAYRGQSARLAATIARRDAVLIEMVNTVFSDLPITEQARSLSRALRSYASTGWPRDRLKVANPHPAKTLRALLFEVLRLRDRPLSAVQIARIIRSDHLSRESV
jgi:hypothetical protein